MAKIIPVAIWTQDPARNAQFYKELFGLKEIAKIDRPGAPKRIRRLVSMPSPNKARRCPPRHPGNRLSRRGKAPQDRRGFQELESIQAFARLMTKRSASSLDLKRSARPPTE